MSLVRLIFGSGLVSVARIPDEKKTGGSVRELAHKIKPVKRHHRGAVEHEPKLPGRMIGSYLRYKNAACLPWAVWNSMTVTPRLSAL